MKQEVILHDNRQDRWLAFDRPVEIIEARSVDEVCGALRQVEGHLARGRWAAGFIAYEAAPDFDPALVAHEANQPLVWFGIYETAHTIATPVSRRGAVPPLDWREPGGRERYAADIHRVRTAAGA